jgi:hypothetical protein
MIMLGFVEEGSSDRYTFMVSFIGIYDFSKLTGTPFRDKYLVKPDTIFIFLCTLQRFPYCSTLTAYHYVMSHACLGEAGPSLTGWRRRVVTAFQTQPGE